MSMRRLIGRLEEASGKDSGYNFDVLKHLVYVDEKARKAVISAASSGDAERLADAVGKLARLVSEAPREEDWVNRFDVRFDGDDEEGDPSDSRAAALYDESADALRRLVKELKQYGFEDAAYLWNKEAKKLAKSFADQMGWD